MTQPTAPQPTAPQPAVPGSAVPGSAVPAASQPGSLPAPEPRREPTDLGYWDVAARGEFRVAHCRACAAYVWFPRSRCPLCTGDELDLVPVSGNGVVYSFTVNRRPTGAYREAGAVVIAYVELAEGPRVLTNLVEIDPARVRIGLPVRAVHQLTPGGAGLIRFAPAGSHGPEAGTAQRDIRKVSD